MDGTVKTFCILGNPVSHSLSPAMHNAAFKAAEMNALYTAFSVKNEDLGKAVEGIRALGIAGASVTIPFKEKIASFLDGVTDIARKVGSVNTLLWKDGRLTGDNTDAAGFYKALSSSVSVKNKTVAVFGSGGSARAVLFGLAHYNIPEKIVVFARNGQKASALKADADASLKEGGRSVLIETAPIESWRDWMDQTDIVVNTTPVGMTPDSASSILKKEEIPEGITVMDIVYRPHLTRLLQNAKAKGCRTVYGIDMLLYQGAEQFRLWTGKKPPLDVMRKVLKKAIG